MSSREMLLVLVAVAVVALAVAGTLFWRNSRHRRGRLLRERFGPEYERVLAAQGDPARAERELEQRARRVRRLGIRELSESERESFAQAWQQAQERFVDTPSIAVKSAHDLIEQVMRARGYPLGDVEQCVADLSVNHAGVVQHYRAALALHETNRNGRDDTEELRQAMTHYHALFNDLLGRVPEASPGSRRLTTAHA